MSFVRSLGPGCQQYGHRVMNVSADAWCGAAVAAVVDSLEASEGGPVVLLSYQPLVNPEAERDGAIR